jgi:hypothetical protein
MLKQKLRSLPSAIEDYVRENFTQVLSCIILLVVVITTLKLQNRILGWEGTYEDLQPQHHGKVSSLSLAIIVTSTLENKFVGYADVFKDDQNNVQYDYFDRYPVFFSVLFNAILSLSSKLSVKMYIAKQVMNFIFLGTLIVAFLITDKLTRNKLLSLSAVLLAFSNPFLLFYKDMVHFDQPALFGFLLLIYAIALYKLDGLKLPVYIITFVAIAFGRGYASYAIFILWLIFEAFLVFRSKELNFWEKLKAILKHPSFFLFVIGIIWGASLLSYNIVVEAQKRDIPIQQTSILDSAERRLSLSEKFNEDSKDALDWGNFTKTQVNRIIQWAFPFSTITGLGFLGNLFLLLVMLILMGVAIWRQPVETRMIYLILIFSGFAWLFPMRNLSAFHDYTAMYYIGIPLVFFLSVFTILNPSKEITHILVIASLAVYMLAIVQVKDLHEAKAGNASAYTYDFEQILNKIDGKGKNIYLADPIPHGPNAFQFYLKDQYLAPLKLADYVIAWDKNYLPTNLTPDNQVIFLFKK